MAGIRVTGGVVEFDGLDNLSRLLANAWPNLTRRVRDIAEREIRTYLREGDLYRVGENAAILLCFLNLDRSEAERKTQLISDRIETVIAREIPATEGQLRPRLIIAPLTGTSSLPQGSSLSERLLGYLRSIRSEEQATRNRRSPTLEKTQLYFSPLWSPSKGMILLNRSVTFTPAVATASRRMQFSNFTRAQLAEADYIALSKTVQSISGMLSQSTACPILVPVHFSTISQNASALVYRKLLDSVSPVHRMLLALEIIAIPAGEPVGEVLEAAAALKPLVKWIDLSLGIGDPRLGEIDSDLIWAVSANLHGARSTDSDVYPSLQRFQSLAARTRLSTIIHGANSIGLAMAAVKAGITYIDGSAVYPVSTVPRPLGPHNPTLSAISSSRVVKRWKY